MRSTLAGLGLILTVLLPTVAISAAESAPSTTAEDLNAFILTPPPPATPRINGPSVFGVRPGNPVLYTIPSTGKSLDDGSRVVGLFNAGATEATVTALWSDLKLTGKQRVRDLWRQKDLRVFEDKFEAPVASHGVILVRIFPAQ